MSLCMDTWSKYAQEECMQIADKQKMSQLLISIQCSHDDLPNMWLSFGYFVCDPCQFAHVMLFHFTLNTWSSSRMTSSAGAKFPLWRAMTFSIEPVSRCGEEEKEHTENTTLSWGSQHPDRGKSQLLELFSSTIDRNILKMKWTIVSPWGSCHTKGKTLQINITHKGCNQEGALGRSGGGLGAPTMRAILTGKHSEATLIPVQGTHLHSGLLRATPKAG